MKDVTSVKIMQLKQNGIPKKNHWLYHERIPSVASIFFYPFHFFMFQF